MTRKISMLLAILLSTVYLLHADNSVSGNEPCRCYSCEGINCQRTTKQNDTKQCTDILDICVTIFDGFMVTARGCYEDLNDAQRAKCHTSDQIECNKCFGQLCNNLGREDFKCIVCDTKEDSNCAKNPSKLSAVQCPAPTTANAYCYVHDSGAEQITRGCSTKLEHQLDCMHDNSCSLCLSEDGVACNAYELDGIRSSATRHTSYAVLALITLFGTNLIKYF